MKKTRRGALALLITLLATFACASLANAQAIGGRRLPHHEPLSISFYKIKPGFEDEWVDLYMKWHRPLVEYDRQVSGRPGTSKLYVRGAHMVSPDWSFAIVYTGPAPDKRPASKKLELTRGEVIKKLFPDVEAYLAGEKRRWELTQTHWDDDFVEVDLTEEHPGVYYPIVPKR